MCTLVSQSNPLCLRLRPRQPVVEATGKEGGLLGIGIHFTWISGRPRPRGLGLRESSASRGRYCMDYEVVLSERCRGISLVSSEDPNIQMWIMGRCVCRYTAQMESLCALAVFFSFFRRFPARLGRPVPGTKGRVLGCRRRVVHARWCATGRDARRRVVLLVVIAARP